MAKFEITYNTSVYDDKKTETVEADDFIDEGEWITFRRFQGPSSGTVVQQVLRVRGTDVKRIDRKD